MSDVPSTPSTVFSLSPPAKKKNSADWLQQYRSALISAGVVTGVVLLVWLITSLKTSHHKHNQSLAEIKSYQQLLSDNHTFTIASDLDSVWISTITLSDYDVKNKAFVRKEERINKLLRSREHYTISSERSSKPLSGFAAMIEVRDQHSGYVERHFISPPAGDSLCFNIPFTASFRNAYYFSRRSAL